MLLAGLGSRAGAAAVSTATLVVCDDVDDPPSLNPYQIFSEKTLTLLQQTLEGLVRFGPSGEIEPALAERWERVDDLTMRFHLRRGVRFHNDEPFNASSVKFSLEKYVAPETRYPGIAFVDTIASVRIIDDDTVDLVTNRPDGLLLNRLAAWAHIVPRGYYERTGDEGFARHPVGTGPFKFESWERGERVVFSANRSYWMTGIPRLGGLVFKFMPSGRQVEALLSGELDVLLHLPGTRTMDVQSSTSAYVLKRPTFYTVVGNFNLAREPLSKKGVRRALNMAIDRKALVRYDLLGNGLPVASVTLAGQFGHNKALEPYPYDPAAAKRLLSEEGYPNGFTLNVLLKVNSARAGQIIAKHLERIGVRMKMTLMTDARIFELMKDRSRWDMMIADCPDPMHHAFFITTIFLGGKSPFSLSAAPGFDERLEKVVRILDVDEQRAAAEELDAYVHSEYLALPTYQRNRTYGIRRGASFVPYISGMPYFFRASIDETKSR